MSKGKKTTKLVNGVLYKRDGNEYAGRQSTAGSTPPSSKLVTVPAKPSTLTIQEVTDPSKLYEQFNKTKLSENSVKINTQYPYPQANSLSKVASVVDAVSGLADTDEGIAAAINVVPRQGAYYATAAGYLGLLTEVGTAPRTWALTALGAHFLESDSDERVQILSQLVEQIPASDAALDEDIEIMSDEIEIEENLSSSTASRRAAALSAWTKTLTSSNASTSLTLETDSVTDRLPVAAAVAAENRDRIRNRPRIEPTYGVCSNCFMQISASGTCGC